MRPLLPALVPLLLAASPALRASHDGAHVQRPTFSPSGDQLAYETNDHLTKHQALFVGPAVAGAFTPVRPTSPGAGELTAGFATATVGPRVVSDLSWSPPALGAYVYTSSDGSNTDLYLSVGSGIAPHRASDGGPAWSPDGQWIAFTSGRSGEGDLYLVQLSALASAPRQLTHIEGSSEVYAAWSPDSRALAFVAHAESGDHLWLLPNLDGEPVQLTRWAGVQTRPSFSPDGTWLAFYANRGNEDGFDMYALRPLHLMEPVLILPEVVPNAHGPVWTPDGRHVLAVAADDDRYDPIVAVPIEDPLRPVVLELGTVGHGDFDVARDSNGVTWLAVTAQGAAGDDVRDFRRLYVGALPALPTGVQPTR